MGAFMDAGLDSPHNPASSCLPKVQDETGPQPDSNLQLPTTIVQAIRFGIVGVLNTGITLAVIFVLMKVLGVHYALSNVIGYLLGSLNSFMLNKKWTFRSKGKVGLQGVLFGALLCVCYLIQLGALVFMNTTVRLISEQIQLVSSTNCFIRLLKSLGNKRYDWLFLEYVDLQNL